MTPTSAEEIGPEVDKRKPQRIVRSLLSICTHRLSCKPIARAPHNAVASIQSHAGLQRSLFCCCCCYSYDLSYVKSTGAVITSWTQSIMVVWDSTSARDLALAHCC